MNNKRAPKDLYDWTVYIKVKDRFLPFSTHHSLSSKRPSNGAYNRALRQAEDLLGKMVMAICMERTHERRALAEKIAKEEGLGLMNAHLEANIRMGNSPECYESQVAYENIRILPHGQEPKCIHPVSGWHRPGCPKRHEGRGGTP